MRDGQAIKPSIVGRMPADYIERLIVFAAIFLFIGMIASSVSILLTESGLYFSFTSSGYEHFLELFSFPLNLLKALAALASLWAVIYNIKRARKTFIINNLRHDLFRCEDEIEEILYKEIKIEEVQGMVSSKLIHKRKNAIVGKISAIGNKTVNINMLVSTFYGLGIREFHGIYCVQTNNLSLRLQRYVVALYELNRLGEEKYLIRYYASKYHVIMGELYQYGSQIDPSSLHLLYQMSFIELKYDFDFSEINGGRAKEIEIKFRKKYSIG